MESGAPLNWPESFRMPFGRECVMANACTNEYMFGLLLLTSDDSTLLWYITQRSPKESVWLLTSHQTNSKPNSHDALLPRPTTPARPRPRRSGPGPALGGRAKCRFYVTRVPGPLVCIYNVTKGHTLAPDTRGCVQNKQRTEGL